MPHSHLQNHLVPSVSEVSRVLWCNLSSFFSALFDLSHMREPEFWLRTKTKVWRQSQRNGVHGRIQKMKKSERISATRGIIISKVTIFVYFLHVSPLKKRVLWNNVMKRSSSSLCWSQAMSWGRIKAIYEEWFKGQRSGGCRKVKKCVQALVKWNIPNQ